MKLFPSGKDETTRTVITMTTSKDSSLFHMDVRNAFLQGDYCEEVYMFFTSRVS